MSTLGWENVETTFDVENTLTKQRRRNIHFQPNFDVVSTSGSDVVSTLFQRCCALWEHIKT